MMANGPSKSRPRRLRKCRREKVVGIVVEKAKAKTKRPPPRRSLLEFL